jgi:hypothetical protein
MLRKSIFLFSVILMMTLAYNPLLASDEYVYAVRTDINSISIVDNGINIEDGFMISEPGAPKISYRVVKLVLPQGKSISSISIETAEPILMGTANLDYVVGDLKTGNYPADTASMPNPEILLFPKTG